MNNQDLSRLDILGLGAVSVDDLVYVESYPPADAKARVLEAERQCGGLTATALVAAARLGSRCAYAGVLGTDELSNFAASCMAAEGIDLGSLKRQPGAGPVHSFIVVDSTRGTRNIFADDRAAVGAKPDWPDPAVISAARVLFVDHLGVEGMLGAALVAKEQGVPIVGDLERDSGPRFQELFNFVDH